MAKNILRSLSAWIMAPAMIMNCEAASAKAMARLLLCSVSGHGGCGEGEDPICVGAGIKDPTIKMVINTSKQTVSLNGIEGRIEGAGPIDAPGNRIVSWRWRLIRLDHMAAKRTPNGKLYITLTGSQNQLEFRCTG